MAWAWRGVAERRRKGHAVGTEHGESVAYSCNYPALLVMIIILLRGWNVFAPQPRLHFRAWVDELIKTFHWLARWVTYSFSLSSLLQVTGSLVHWQNNITHCERRDTGKRCNQQNWGRAPSTSVHQWQSVCIRTACLYVCVPRQGSCLIIRAKSANRLDWETPGIHLSKFHHWTRHSIASAHPEWCLTNRHSGMFLAEKFVSVTCKKLVTKTVFRGQNVSLIKSQSSTTPCETQKGHFQKISLLSSLVMYRV